MGGGGGGAGGAASCVTVCACDPTVTVPVRGSVAVFGTTVYSTLPEPVPEVLPGMPIQLTDVPAVHVQEAADAAGEGLLDVVEAVPIERRARPDRERGGHGGGPEREVPGVRGG